MQISFDEYWGRLMEKKQVCACGSCRSGSLRAASLSTFLIYTKCVSFGFAQWKRTSGKERSKQAKSPMQHVTGAAETEEQRQNESAWVAP